MRLAPFASVDGLPFSTTRTELVVLLGPPARDGLNGVGLHELDYGNAVYRFQLSGRLEEVTVEASVVHLGNVAVPRVGLERFVDAHDATAFRRAGFVVSPRFGVAFDPREPPWVTALARHCLPQWRAL
jgi:hypothetical protein